MPLTAGARIPFLQYVVCLSVVAALQEVMEPHLPSSLAAERFPVRIKWPNDIHVKPNASSETQKIGGILCHTVSCGQRQSEYQAVIGIGLNVSNAQPSTCVHQVMESMAEDKSWESTVNREHILAAIFSQLEDFAAV
jgi:biotin---protein ligase